ncbi:MAG: DUF6712 family protein [Phocaeicola sp.]
MIFSYENWESADELKRFIPVSTALNFARVESSLNDAFNLFFRPLFGEEVSNRVIEIYRKTDREEHEKVLLEEAQRAVANLAFWYNFTELSIRITDQGFQRQESETFKQTYKYQEDELRNSFKNKGFNSLDRIITLLNASPDYYPEFIDSPAYCLRRKCIVPSTTEVNGIYFINFSHIIFLRLKPYFKMVEETILNKLIGHKLFEALLACLDKEEKNLGSTTVEELRVRCAQVVVFHAIAQLIRATGSLTDRGLYFEQIVAGKNGNQVSSPAGAQAIISQALQLEQTAGYYADALLLFIQEKLPDYYQGKPSEIFHRDNDNKSSVWL